MKKCKNYLSFLVILLFIQQITFAQKQGNIWYFGHHAGLDFSYNPPLPLTNGATYNGALTGPFAHSEGTAVMCDSAGYLLFYTNGRKIWNRYDQVMPNGDSILGHWSSTQSAIIVPSPGSSRYFYVFTTDAFLQDELQYGFRYSVVDVCADNGLGDVIPVLKNIKLLDTVTEKLTAVKHANGSDYWIITHKYFSDAFYAYHLSWLGIEDTVISHVGSVHPAIITTSFPNWATIGQLKASPDGSKLVIVNGNSGNSIAEYFDFNKTTGIVSNCVNIQTDTSLNWNYYGASFSPDNSKIYIACMLNGPGIYQFDLNAGNGNPDSVRASKIRVSNGNNDYYGLQLAVDGKIYASIYRNGGPYLSVINNPNFPGLFCDCQDSAIYLYSGLCSYSFPNFMDSYAYTNGVYRCEIVSDESLQHENIKMYPNPANEILYIEGWENNIPAAIYDLEGRWVQNGFIKDGQLDVSLLNQGMYFIKLTTGEGSVVRKFVKE
jgi:hypothetical protein